MEAGAGYRNWYERFYDALQCGECRCLGWKQAGNHASLAGIGY